MPRATSTRKPVLNLEKCRALEKRCAMTAKSSLAEFAEFGLANGGGVVTQPL
jgi:hypothetical protein